MFRLHLDIELYEDEETSRRIAEWFLPQLKEFIDHQVGHTAVRGIKYRLGRDEDRTPKNFLDKNENGHARGGKAKLFP